MLPRKRFPLVECIWIVLFSSFILNIFPVRGEASSAFEPRSRDGQLRQFAFDAYTNSVYVSSINSLYWLSSELRLMNSLELGPMNDNVNCPINARDECLYERTSMPAVSQALAIDPMNRTLIVCSTLYHGSCWNIDMRGFIPRSYIYKPVVTNDPNGSTVMFLSQGREPVLYVGTSYSGVGSRSYRDSVGMISFRNVSTLDFAWKSNTGLSSIDLLSDYRSKFPVNFVGGFEFNNFIYFFVTHSSSLASSELMTYVMRICKNDLKLQSFIEIPLECKVGGTAYQVLKDVTLGGLGTTLADTLKEDGVVVYGVFTPNTGEINKGSAVCVYSMNGIEKRFQETIQSCVNGDSFTGPAFMTRPVRCTRKPNIKVPLNYCGEQNTNYPMSGNNPIQSISTATIRDAVANSLLVKTTEHGTTVAFVGMQSGLVLKLKLSSRENLNPVYGSVKGKQTELLPVKNMVFGFGSIIYTLTDAGVYSIKTHDCGVFDTCNKCIQDPHCGWCMSMKKCGLKSQCNSSSLWLTDTCPLIVGLSPSQISVDRYNTTKIIFTLNFLPVNLKSIECRMEERISRNLEFSKAVVYPANVVTCPPFKHTPVISNNKTYANMSLSVVANNMTWITAAVNVYNCGLHSSCSGCTSTIFSCRWCTVRHKCQAAQDECPSVQGIQTGIEQTSSCPRVEFPADKTFQVMPAGTRQSFTLLGINLLKIYLDKLKCQFRIDSQVIQTRASYRSNDPLTYKTPITCDPVELDYYGNQTYVTVPLDIVWDWNQPLDQPTSLNIRLYKCRYLVSSCGRCITIDASYKCGWCGDHCSLQNDCSKGWMDRNYTCPSPHITSFSPPGGPVRGGTKVTINGVNLGAVASDLDVTIAGQKCAIITSSYIPSERVTCLSGSTGVPRSGPVAVTVKGLHTTSSRSSYHYKDPVFLSVFPRRGPYSGGSLVTINGTNLDFGSSVLVTINQKSAKIVSRNSTKIELLTPSQSKTELLTSSMAFKVKVDDGSEIIVKDHFIYIDDPNVLSIDPRISLISGGSVVDVKGSNLNGIQKPQIIVYIGYENKTAPCKTLGPSFMQCQTPDLTEMDDGINQETLLDFGFIMDNTTGLLNVPKTRIEIDQFSYFPRPLIRAFLPAPEYKKGEKVAIQGQNVAVLSKFRDLHISVGGVKCESFEDNGKDLLFMPPENPATNEVGLAVITVKVGNFYEEVGYLSYRKEEVTLGLVLGLGLGFAFLLTVGIIVAVVVVRYRRRKHFNLYKSRTAKLQDVEDRKKTNSYTENKTGKEGVPLKSSTTDLKEVEYYCDEDVDYKDGELYFQAILRRMDNSTLQRQAKQVFIARERIQLGNLLGRGHFGQVFAAKLRDEDMTNPIPVAVKTVEDTSFNSKVVESFLREGVIMKKFNHPHVLSLLGISCGLRKEPMVVLPFMANGDLQSFVKDKSREFTARQLLYMAQQVAKGMCYLSSLNFIHRDLAARNCMIDDNNQVKVADFGLSHELYDREYYCSQDRKAKLPIKWMALESLEDFLFTTKSDVWSFGVLMWELMTRGVTPYPDVEVFETRNYLAKGYRLRKPKYCPDNIYAIMMSCWEHLPERRPSFGDLVNQMEVLLNPPRPKLPGTGDDEEPAYVNITDPDSNYLQPVNSV